jgi:hypothetical protein
MFTLPGFEYLGTTCFVPPPLGGLGGKSNEKAWERYELAQDCLILAVSDCHWEEIKDSKTHRVFRFVRPFRNRRIAGGRMILRSSTAPVIKIANPWLVSCISGADHPEFRVGRQSFVHGEFGFGHQELKSSLPPVAQGEDGLEDRVDNPIVWGETPLQTLTST